LKQIVERQTTNNRNWDLIASEHGNNRPAYACFKAYKRQMPTSYPAQKWNQEQDRKLLELIKYYGSGWNEIATYFPGRSRNQCLLRFNKSVNPSISRGIWSKEECDVCWFL
jgi:hypothetical protein